MDLLHISRVRTLSILLVLFISVYSYEIPEVTIEVTPPKGFKASIQAEPGIGLFVFHGNVNTGIVDTQVGSINGEVLSSREEKNGRYEVNVPDAELKVGDVINYYVFVLKDKKGYLKDNLKYTVRDANYTSINNNNDNGGDTPSLLSDCRPTVTKVRGGKACAGHTIFEENFDSIRENVWQIEQYIPFEHPEFPFVSYQRQKLSTVSTSDGQLSIRPKLLQDQLGFTNDSIVSGSLDLVNGCTGSATECFTQASGASILPPVVSGRITTKEFAFTYGTVEVRAKLPKGDWLYPELLLEPFIKKYGKLQYAGGVLKIATARGNTNLNEGAKERGNKILYGGAIMDFKCRSQLIREFKSPLGKMWGDDFHIYSVKWTPDDITLLVDNVEWAKIEPAYNGLVGHFPSTCDDLPRDFLNVGSKMAPFDDHFYITLGVAAGGITEFADGVSGLTVKPWRNSGRKASLNFWQALNAWYPTWSEGALTVDYVKVYAL